VAQANVKLTVNATQATSALKSVQNQTKLVNSGVNRLKTALASVGIGLLAKNTITAATSFEKLNQRLKILTKENGTYSQSLNLATEAQTKFGLSSIDALEGVTNLQARLAPLGSTMDEITAIFNGFNTAAILSGASAQEQAGAMRQLTQALGSGVLRGDEFNSISEQMSAVLKPIADQLGVNVGALREMAANGKITKDVVVAAFKEIEKEGGKALKELIKNDPTMVFKVLNNEVEKLSIEIGKVLTPAVLDATSAFTSLLRGLNNFLNTSEGQTALVITGIAFAVKGLSVASGFLSASLTVLIAKFKLTSAGAIALAKAQSTASVTTKALAIATGGLTLALKALPLVAIATGFVLLTNAIIKAINKQKEFNKLLEEGSSTDIQNEIDRITKSVEKLQEKKDKVDGSMINIFTVDQQIELEGLLKKLDKLKEKLVIAQGVELFRDFEKTKNALEEKNKKLKESVQRSKIATEEGRKQFDIELRRQELIEKYGEELANTILQLEEENRKLEKGAELIKKKGEETEKLKEKFAAVGQEIEQNIKDELKEAIKGAKSFGDAMNAVLNKIQDKLIELAIDDLFSGINKKDKGGGIGGFIGNILGGLFADGGRPPVGKASIVGEKGPELFIPSTAGTIIPNNKLGGGDSITNIVNVSVDASGSSVEGDDATSQQLGQTIALVVQETLVREKRNGGLLA